MPIAIFKDSVPKETWLNYYGQMVGTILLKKLLPIADEDFTPAWESFHQDNNPVIIRFNSVKTITICINKQEYLKETEEVENKYPRIIYTIPIKTIKTFIENYSITIL